MRFDISIESGRPNSILLSNPFGGIGAICVSINLGRRTQTSLLSHYSFLITHNSLLTAHSSSACHKKSPISCAEKGEVL